MIAPPAALLLMVLLLPHPAAAALRALVIGIDAYQYEAALAGAINDAEAVANAIRPMAVSVTRLTDTQVRRPAVLAALAALLAASAPGDTVLVAYSGHGGRERVRTTPETPTGYREFWVMADFNRQTPQGIAQRVLSTEIGDWLARARAAGVRVVLLADHCHSGKIYRSVGVDTGNIRSIATLISPDVPPDEPPPRIGELQAAPPPPGLVSLAADTADKPVAEFRISAVNRVHGALSFAFAHALTGGRRDLDPGGTGRVTVGALQSYLARAVNLMSDGQQYAQLRTGEPEATLLFTLPGAPPPLAEGGIPPLALHVSGVPAREGEALAAATPGAQWEPDPAHARLVWQRRPGVAPLVTGTNMFVHFNLARADLPAVVQTIRVSDALAARAMGGRLRVAVTRAGGTAAAVYFSGEHLAITARDLPGPQLVVFNLTAEGTVQFLYPMPSDPPIAWPSAAVRVLDTDVRPTFGGDHLVAVSGARPLGALVSALRALDGRAEAEAAHAAVQAALQADPAAQLAVAGLFTADRARRCDPEVVRDAAMAAVCPRARP